MMEAPPITVFMRLAWPGQSTNVNYMCSTPFSFSGSLSRSQSGTATTNAEKPRSSVMPRSFDYGLLSKLAVDVTVLRARQRDVFPESIWPSTPTLMFKILDGSTEALSTKYML